MAQASLIEWTEVTWNPVTGCTKFSEGCMHCYAERMARRLHGAGNPRYRNGFKVTLHQDLVESPFKWKKPRLIFVNSMGDLFHKDVPLSFIKDVFATMNRADHHIYQVVTKRAGRLAQLADKLEWTPNIWMGVTVESNRHLGRIDDLRSTGASVKFLSMEPLLTDFPVLDLEGIDWVIVGGESGPGARPMSEAWVESIHSHCIRQDVSFFFKQWGGVRKKAAGRTFKGRTWDEMPPCMADQACLSL
ncbi:MAG: phage Gp37/Gp68 family protein [Phycisphaerae bacterium]|nr:phage Gp37/Gp68 family protein [Phycisphaerae bacterium]